MRRHVPTLYNLVGEDVYTMSNAGSSPSDVFDVRKVRRLVELMHEYDLAEIDLQQSEQRIRLKKGHETPPVAAAPPAPAAPAPTPAPAASTAPAETPPGESAEASGGRYIVSPMVGTFYLSASPEAPPFVKPGDQVGPDTVVCIIEAMKVFNEIAAECSGKIVAVLVENGDPIEFGQKLFQVE